MRSRIIAAIALGTFLAGGAAPAAAEKGKGPCAEDAARFCKEVKPGEGRVAACLKEHEKELSGACAERRAQLAEKRAGRGGGGACLRAYGDGFERGFRRGLSMRPGRDGREAAGKKKNGFKVCAADAKKLCGDVKPGEGRVRDCLIKNLDKLSGGCKARAEKARARLEKKGDDREKKA